ncbi:hypothetical protein [Hymenobacter swuensis]|uniref:Uncharacterized protein n=1 Tax=Hymenobacter swuensis DY53 TaxID=1227739 RepID=W8EYD5_9BACT|nr:hypothetical protein [Hymenobacter swuensis]AHJ96782.1 hypothetical protein Hsw_1187 [Hymenobacter swuensis DY53]
MTRFFALFLAVLILLQTFSRELLVMDYQARKAEITRLFCVNKNKPRLHCNGKCHLRRQLGKAADTESKAPGAGFAKVKYEVLAPLLCVVLPKLAAVYQAQVHFGPCVASCYAFSSVHGVFHPPTAQA